MNSTAACMNDWIAQRGSAPGAALLHACSTACVQQQSIKEASKSTDVGLHSIMPHLVENGFKKGRCRHQGGASTRDERKGCLANEGRAVITQ